MRQVIISESEENIELYDVGENTPIFVKNEKGKFIGMLVKEEQGWIIKIGGDGGWSGYWGSRKDCLRHSIKDGYTFYIESD